MIAPTHTPGDPESPRGGAPDLGGALPRGLGLTLVWMAVFLLLSAVLLRESIDVGRLLAAVANARMVPLLAGFCLLFGGLVCMSLRWRALLPAPRRIDRVGMVAICSAGQLLNMSLPGPVGEVVAAGLVRRRFGIDPAFALATSLHARFVGVTTAALVTLVVWLLVDLPVPEAARPLVAGAVVMVAGWGLCMGAMAVWPGLLVRPCARAAEVLGRRPRGLLGRWTLRGVELGGRFGSALAALGRGVGRQHAVAAAWNACGLASVTFGGWIAALALGDPGSLAGFLFTHSAVTAGAVLLFALPGAQVGWDAAFAALLVAAVGLPLENALAVTVLVRVQQLSTVALGGIALPWLMRGPAVAPWDATGGAPG